MSYWNYISVIYKSQKHQFKLISFQVLELKNYSIRLRIKILVNDTIKEVAQNCFSSWKSMVVIIFLT